MHIFRFASPIAAPAVLVLALAGCGDDGGAGADAASNVDAPVGGADATVSDGSFPDASSACLAPNLPGGTNHQFVANSITIPTMGTQANDLSLDIDGDGNSENQLGEVIVLFSAMADLGIQASVDEQVADGSLLYIANVDAADVANTSDAQLRMFLGQDCDFPPNAADNFSGSELFQVGAGSPLDNMVSGPVASGVMDLGPGSLTVITPIPNVGNIALPLWGARITGDLTGTTISNGIIAGGIKDEDVQSILIPALHQTIAATVDEACPGTAQPNCMCDPQSAGDDLIQLLDSNADCDISLDEVQNSLIASLLAPDLDLFDSQNGNVFDPNKDGENDSLSLGVGFAMVGAQFELP